MAPRWQLPLDPEDFLARYWQREPLLIPSALPDFVPPISADELAGLAMEDGVEARLVAGSGKQWEQWDGPFKASDYQRGGPWTLLVQSVDHWLTAVSELRRIVDFLPAWRIDDVMVSYATDGGSVGPHYDNYDVFLLQGEGRRRWRLGQRCDENSPLIPHEHLRLLAQFDQQKEYLLEPGDILYVPPGVAHWGVAEGECTTFSIGFRAPRVNDLLSRYADHVLDNLSGEVFFSDAGRTPQSRPGEISQDDIERATQAAARALAAHSDHGWFGELVTEPSEALEPCDDPVALLDRASASGALCLSPEAKLAWTDASDRIEVYANGYTAYCDRDVLPALVALCEHWQLAGEELDKALALEASRGMLEALAVLGCLYAGD